jgi:hypothetical protein
MPKSARNPDIAALGFRVHSGWVAAVAVGGDPRAPVVVDRRRIELADHSIPGSVQPFHAAKGLDIKKAEKFIARCTESADALAEPALRQMIAALSGKGLQVIGTCLVLASGRPVGTLESTLASHPMIHTAEGEFFRQAIRRASEKSSVPVTGIKEREILGRVSDDLGLSSEELQQQIAEMGRVLGPPWRQDEKLAALAAWIILAAAPGS